MDIFEYYVERNHDSNWVELYQSTAHKNYGKTFIYVTTNYRFLSSFIDIFNKFYSYNGLDRSEWSHNAGHGQEDAKQWTVNMTQSKLFKRDKSIYNLTAKGKAFKEFLDLELGDNSNWILLYLFLNNSYFGFIPNYINKKCKEIMTTFIDSGYSKEYILGLIKEFLQKKDIKTPEIFNNDIFWLLTFYKDKDFLSLYKVSSDESKKKLFSLAVNNFHSKTYADCISKKYKPSGQYHYNTFIDDLKVLYFSTIIADSNPSNLTDYLDSLFKAYSELYYFDKEKVIKFIADHEDIFQIIYKETYGDIEEDIVNDYEYSPRDITDVTEEKVDDTTANNETTIRHMSSVLKRMAKERTNYLCELDDLFGCKYFTSKENNKNYLEIHHLVPREFSNEFENSIEIIDNYVALCPHCHRLIHFATDRERVSALNYLYNKRKNKLEEKGIKVDIKTLKKFYDIEE